MDLLDADTGVTHIVSKFDTEDEEMNAFLLRLGCYQGEPITVISKSRRMCTVVFKNGRYTIDSDLARIIQVEPPSST